MLLLLIPRRFARVLSQRWQAAISLGLPSGQSKNLALPIWSSHWPSPTNYWLCPSPLSPRRFSGSLHHARAVGARTSTVRIVSWLRGSFGRCPWSLTRCRHALYGRIADGGSRKAKQRVCVVHRL